MESHLIQLFFALLAGLIFYAFVNFQFNLAYIFLVLLIPFQIIDSKYGSLNFAVSFVFLVVLFLRRRARIKLPAPLTLSFFLLIMCMVPALYWTPKFLLKTNLIYIVNFAQNIIMLVLAVNYLQDEERVKKFFYVLAVGNVLVIAFFLIQSIVGSQGFAPMGISEFAITSRTDKNARLLGPFSGSQAGVTYLVIQSMFCLYALLTFVRGFGDRIFWSLLLVLNTSVLIGTGTRSGFLGFCLALAFMFVFLSFSIGFGKSLKIFSFGALTLSIMAFAVINYTKYNVMFERLKATEIEGLEVDSRKGLIPLYWDQIVQRPLFGSRPMHAIPDPLLESSGLTAKRSHVFIASPPHNFYVYTLFTTGFLGFFAHLLFLFLLFFYLLKAKSMWRHQPGELNALPLLFISVFAVFLIMQLFISYSRFNLSDFQDYLFTVFGMFLSLYLIAQKEEQSGALSSPEPPDQNRVP